MKKNIFVVISLIGNQLVLGSFFLTLVGVVVDGVVGVVVVVVVDGVVLVV